MQHLASIGEIKQRAAALRLSLEDLALAAKLSPSTAYRAAAALHDSRVSTLVKLTEALIAEERRLFAHLSALPTTATEESRHDA